MTRLLTIMALLFAAPAWAKAEIYYCATDAIVGFEPNEDWEFHIYKEERFTAEIDFEKKTMSSNGIGAWGPVAVCDIIEADPIFYCSWVGRSFLIDPGSLKFTLSSGILGTDSVFIAHGTCEKF